MAALITADADATMAADVITDVDVTVDGDFQAEIIPAVISSGSSSFCACETITADAAMAAADVATVTTAGLLSCCFCCVETMAVDVAADNHFLLAGDLPSAFIFYRIIISSLLFMLPDIILIFHIPGIDPVCFLFPGALSEHIVFLFHTLKSIS